MDKDEIYFQQYVGKLPILIGEHNGGLIAKFLNKYQALPSAPGTKRLTLLAMRLKSVCVMINKAPLDSLTEQDLITLNLAMRKKGLLSAHDYRKSLRQFLRLTDKKKYYDLLESDYLRSPPKKANDRLLVDPDTFWNKDEIARYLQCSKEYSLRQAAWAGLWLSCGARPHELLNLTKRDIEFDEEFLTVRIQNGKTGKRSIVLNDNYGKGAWNYIKPYWETLTPNEKLFNIGWHAIDQLHHVICKQAKIGKDKKINLYVARKMVLTRFYNDYKLVKAATLAGHVPGSKSMKNYVALTEQQLRDDETPTISTKFCPNSSCGQENEPHQTYCIKCSAPLDRKKFSDIFDKKVDEIVKTQIELIKSKIENATLKAALD
ncbi:MAG: site-specific integrase [Candidatus Diapherotrites archaeon]|nr:site-specific integrase [Candidatus Diapherotrites archaeon]